MTSEAPHPDIARAALAQYPINVEGVDFFRHSGSSVHRVTDLSGSTYALRLHRHISEFLGGDWQTPEVINSEMVWLSHLHDETDITVQEPIRTERQTWVAMVEEDDGTPLPCTLHRWLEGACPAPPFSAHDACSMARLLAKLHTVAEQWAAPAEFTRPVRDKHHVLKALSRLENLLALGVIKQNDLDNIRMAVDKILPIIAQLETGPQNWGLIHADLIPSNIIVHQGVASPIDFSEASFGCYLHDVAVSLLRLGAHRRTFLDVYQQHRALPDNAQELTEAFLIVQFVEWLAFLSSVPERHERAARATPQIANDVCGPFLNGTPFLYEQETYAMKTSNKEIQATN